MTTFKINKNDHESKLSLQAGVDVGSEELILVVRKNSKALDPQKFSNTPADRARLVKKLVKLPGIIVCLEATGIYHFDLAIALHDAGVLIMVINPKASHNFAKVLMKNSKTDAVDANTLAEYAERMDFVAWTRPSDEKIALRCFSRRINSLTNQKAAAKNHLHALTATQETPKAVLNDAKLAIIQLQKRIDRLAAEALVLIGKYPELTRTLQLLIGIKGIAETSAIALMGELLLLPPDLSHREWVKFAGLDPRAFDSGKSVHKKTRISKAGNRYIRSALYMPALSAKQHDPHVKAYFQHLVVDNGKKKLQAVCAVMRKLLHAIHGMLKHDVPFDNTRFYVIPTSVG
ncbi:IS110 family transposase [Methylobacter sp.]|uniref:IS110 family transposase n=1 Tax=Methylobacter sp. TaxID=2051955 RepID=UPI00248949FD|nr:IS110 family transposase [Methylobacter sp.]MDI1276880.1 IS110 family transposase [Methylobacter sp.]MDI1357546.1 IS110 family transposase [Methylobacter sp.]